MEELLHGGIANAGAVVRIGDAVLRPANPHSRSIHRLLSALRDEGFDGASEPLGIDDDGRERLRFVEGDVALPPYPDWVQSDDLLGSAARLLRRFHDASARVVARLHLASATWSDELADPGGGTVLCHNDVCWENVVVRDGEAVCLLDFDFAAPGRRTYDLAQFARMCVPVDDDRNATRNGWAPADRPRRLRLVAESYGLGGERLELIDHLDHTFGQRGEFVRRRVEAGEPAFVAMWNAMGGQERFDRRLRWWESERAEFVAALR